MELCDEVATSCWKVLYSVTQKGAFACENAEIYFNYLGTYTTPSIQHMATIIKKKKKEDYVQLLQYKIHPSAEGLHLGFKSVLCPTQKVL